MPTKNYFEKFFQKKSQTVGIKVFLTIFAWWLKNPDTEPDPYLWLMDPEGQKHVDPVDPDSDPDPEHWYKVN